MSVSISISHALKKYGNNTVIPDLSLEIRDGEFFTLLGSSGCGKTTLLRMIAGFNSIEGGDFYFNDRRINDVSPEKRNIGMVFQNYAVFPHMTAYENVAFGLEERRIKDPEKKERVMEMLSLVQISELKDRKPENMSGGQQQRIALARAIVIKPDVLLMDEPLSNLDAKLRIEMRSVIRNIQRKFGITTVYVTHDQSEALSISDRIAVMDKGVIKQIGTPYEIYSHPKNLFTATFIGESSLIDGEYLGSNEVSLLGFKFLVPGIRKDYKKGRNITVCVRPDDFVFSSNGLKGKIVDSSYLGINYEYIIELDESVFIKADIKARGEKKNTGEDVFVFFDPTSINVFDKESGESVMEGFNEG